MPTKKSPPTLFIGNKGSLAVRLIRVPSQIILLNTAHYSGLCVMGQMLHGSRQKGIFLLLRSEEGKKVKKEDFPFTLGYISALENLKKKNGVAFGMSRENGQNATGLSPAGPITPQHVREKSTGQTKGVHEKCYYRGHETGKDKLVSRQ